MAGGALAKTKAEKILQCQRAVKTVLNSAGFLLQGEGKKIEVCPKAHKIYLPKHCGKKTNWLVRF